MTRILRNILLVGVALGNVTAGVRAAAPVAEAPAVDYLTHVKPLLTARCYACHGALKQEGGLRLDTAAAIRSGGDSGSAVDPRSPDKSLLFARVTAADVDERMPPEGEGSPLKADEAAILKSWIAAGAVGPADEKPEADPRDHWAFRPPQRPAVPRVNDSAWVRNPIDAFILAELEERGLRPQPPAEPGLLLRRVYLDLTGLPPTLDEIEAFRSGEIAYEQVVDKLLASPQYGERWGRHWMDVWRYSDWWGLGADVRNSQKHIWHWRDWIVESLNDDVGYDEMLRQMLAADELYPDDLDKLRATGYLVRSYFKFNRNTWLEQVVEHTSKGFLGLTLNCTRCHDHKYDPFAQRDFYRLRAFFEPYQVRTDQLPGEADLERDGLPRVFDCHLDAPTYRYVRGDETKPVKDEPIAPGLPKLVAPQAVAIVPVSLPATAHRTGLRPWVLDNLLAEAETKRTAAQDELSKARKQLKEADDDRRDEAEAVVESAEAALTAAAAQLPSLQARAAADRAQLEASIDDAKAAALVAAAAERGANVAQARAAVAAAEVKVQRAAGPGLRMDAEKNLKTAQDNLAKAEQAAQATDGKYTPLAGSLKAFESSVESDAERKRPYPETSTGRRTALAAMLVDPANPLTARVAVNHIWLRHMGKPLVPTVFDFGRKGTPPTHPKLLDWLAAELREEGWSMKRLHRRIVTSRAYRMSSSTAGNEAAASLDRDNVYYWRMNPIRLEAQAVRDALLHLSDELDLTQGGPGVDPAKNEFSTRRSLYFVHSHNEHHRFLAMFDDADVLDCYRRDQSIVPQQALALANAKQSLAAAGRIAAKLSAWPQAQTEDGFLRAAFTTILAYEPTADEQAVCGAALHEWRKSGDDERARTNLVHALLNHNDFITVK